MSGHWSADDIRDAIAKLRSGKSCAEVALELDRSTDSLRKAFQQRRLGPPSSYVGRDETPELDRAAALGGWSPEHDYTRVVPPGFHLRGVSTLYDGEGNISAQWVKSQLDREGELAAMIEAVKAIAEPFRGTSEVVEAPRSTNESILVVYPMGDPHLGMYSWVEETGASFDLDIAERSLVRTVDRLVALAPPADRALVLNLGDFFHSDNNQNRTSRSGNALDVDTRWAKVLSVGVRTMRRIIDRALERHAYVDVINEIGNHDDHASIMLSICLAQYYENNPRVRVDTSPAAFHWLRFGKCLLGVTHGHTVKADKLPGVMATDRAKDWGETLYRHWYTGHVHHDTLKEFPGCTVETVRTLAARDAWHAAQGYRSGRDMKADVWHKDYGRILRHTVGIEMIEGTEP